MAAPSPHIFDKSTGEEDVVLNIIQKYPQLDPLPKFNSKPTLVPMESLSGDTFKPIGSREQITRNNGDSREKLTYFMNPTEKNIMLSSYQNLPKMSYFSEINKPKYEKFGDIVECDFGFSFKKFFLFGFYHALYYFILGPAIFPLLYFWKGKPILANLNFTGWNYFCLTQTIEYVMILLSLIFYCAFIPNAFLYGCELYTIYISVFFWICTLSIKYATMSDEKITFLHEKYLTPKEMTSESIVLYKLNKEDLDKHIMKELLSVISRNDIDISLFQVKFIRDLEGSVKKQLIQNDKEFIGKIFSSDEEKKYSGMSLVKQIVSLGFMNNFDSRIFECISIVLAFIISSIPFFYKFFDQKIFWMTGGEVIISLFLMATNTRFYYKNMTFALNILYEYRKLAVFLSHLSQLLSPKTVVFYSKKKVFPTIDIFSPTVLESWDTMHKICRNFDKKLRFRIDCFISLAIILNLAGAILIILIITDNTNFFGGFYVYSIFLNIIFAFLTGCALIRYGIIINQYYDVHKKIIWNNLKVYNDLNNHYPLYFDQEEGKFENELYREGTERITSCCDDYFAKELMNLQGDQMMKNMKKLRLNMISSLRKVAKNLIGNLEFQSKDEPFKIVGIPATSPILTSIMGIIISFSIAIIQLQVKKYFLGPEN